MVEVADGHGLVGVREGVALFGGSLSHGVTPDGGFRLAATLPVTGQGA
jgi:signal transduction histidine kinase